MTAYDTMTLQSCASDCAGYAFCPYLPPLPFLFKLTNPVGTEYGRECYCGNSFATGSVSAPQGDCYFPCAGNSAEICGAGVHLSVYATSVSVVAPAAPPTPSNPATIGNYDYFSCMTEGANSRALQGKTTAYDTMTLESCAADCAGFTYCASPFLKAF